MPPKSLSTGNTTSHVNDDPLVRQYRGKRKSLQKARAKLRSLLKEAITQIEDKQLVRAQLGSVRIKDIGSLRKKAAKNDWSAERAFRECGDLVGGRVVCSNTKDVYRFVELLKENLSSDWEPYDIQDQILKPNKHGYRALHVNLGLDVGETPLHPERIPCEIQIRTRLQDAWAELSHNDIYKQEGLPADLSARFSDLAEILAAADRIAGEIRLRVAQEMAPPEHLPKLDRVTIDGLISVFRDVYGRNPSDYIIRTALNVCQTLDIRSISELPVILQDPDFRSAVAHAYEAEMPVPVDVDTVFLAAVRAVGSDLKAAVEQVRHDAKVAWEEIDQIGQREAATDLPSTVEEMVHELVTSNSEESIQAWEDALGVTHECGVCGAPVVDPYSFAEAAVQYYECGEGLMEEIEKALRNSSGETGGWGDGKLCAYHNDQFDRD